MILFFFILLRLSFSWFTKYFDQIVSGVDKLAEEADETIVMSSELNFMEIKLNEFKDKLKKRTEQARAEEQRKNDLVVYLAHDIKTPLTSVIGYLSLLNEAPDMPPEQKAKYVGIALDKAYRLEKLISEFFEITRYNLQYVPLNKENINLCYMMVQIADELYPQVAASGKQIKTIIKEDIIIYGDSEKLARVINNVLKNAIAYSMDDSTIYITAEANPEKVVIRFVNRGDYSQGSTEFNI
jgi:two-component system sensor histidine kinase VanS